MHRPMLAVAACLLFAATLTACGGGSAKPMPAADRTPTHTGTMYSIPVTAADFGADWPFTVDEGVLICDGGEDGKGVGFVADGTAYGLNEPSLRRGADSADPVWAETAPGKARKSMEPVIARGLALCP